MIDSVAVKKCKNCETIIFDDSIVCPHCGKKILSSPYGKIFLFIFVILITSSFLLINKNSTSVSSEKNLSSSSESSASDSQKKLDELLKKPTPKHSWEKIPELEIQSWRCDREHGYIFVRGEVKNITENKMKNISVVGSFYSKEGEFIKTADAIVQYNPLMSGQKSPFSAGTTDNPLIKDCKIAFKFLSGEEIEHITKTKSK